MSAEADWLDIGAAAALADSVPWATEVEGWPVIVVRCGDAVHAVEDRCTHDGEPLGQAEIVDCQVICPRHGARFCLRSGEALTPPAYEPLRRFTVRIDGERILMERPPP